MLLGPGVDVARVARNGRTAESLAGEEPALGAVLAHEYVMGLQGERVAAVAKHFAGCGRRGVRTSDARNHIGRSALRATSLRRLHLLATSTVTSPRHFARALRPTASDAPLPPPRRTPCACMRADVQETHRALVIDSMPAYSMDGDERTLMEIYYPPIQVRPHVTLPE